SASTITPEPALVARRSGIFWPGGMLKKRRKNGSSSNGLRWRTRVLVAIFTTAGVARSSIGASDGNSVPSPSASGKAACACIASKLAPSTSNAWSLRYNVMDKPDRRENGLIPVKAIPPLKIQQAPRRAGHPEIDTSRGAWFRTPPVWRLVGVVQAHLPELRRFGQVRPGGSLDAIHQPVARRLQVTHPRVRQQYLRHAAELRQQRQVVAVIKNIRRRQDVHLVEPRRHVGGQCQCHALKCRDRKSVV